MSTCVPCIVCGYVPESAVRDTVVNQPHAATTFTTHGHYGSTIFDPMSIRGLEVLEINVCDECLRTKAREGVILHRDETPNSSTFKYETWVPHDA